MSLRHPRWGRIALTSTVVAAAAFTLASCGSDASGSSAASSSESPSRLLLSRPRTHGSSPSTAA